MKTFIFLAIAGTLLLLTVRTSAITQCYGDLQCFSDDAPFSNSHGVLPAGPSEIGTRFFLYTSGNNYPYQLYHNFPAGVNSSSFDSSYQTKVIIHGFDNSLQSAWVHDMKEAFLATGSYNVMTVGWGPGAAPPDYPQAVSNTRMVARQLARLLQLLVHVKGLTLGSVHLIGFSLGAQLAGYVSGEIGYKVGRITGLDPAGLMFQSYGPAVYLDATDAIFVDIIHSNAEDGGAGMFISQGHVDFFPNGGTGQPGCGEGHGLNICSHARSHQIFISSIYNSCNITSFPCASQASYAHGDCLGCGPIGCNKPGLYARSDGGLGNQFFATSDTAPFCGQNYMITIEIGNQFTSVNGDLKVSLRGDWGYTGWVTVASGHIPRAGDGLSRRNVVFKEQVGTIRSILVQFTPAPEPDPAVAAAVASSVLGGGAALGGLSLPPGAGAVGALLPLALAAARGDRSLQVVKIWVQPVPDGRPMATYGRATVRPNQSMVFNLQ